jgi:TrmH family RNA methyltransferase
MKLEQVRRLHQKKFRDELGCFLAEGEHLVLELQKAAEGKPALRSTRLFVTAGHADWPGPFEKQVIDERQMARISDTREPQGIVAVVPKLPVAAPRQGEKVVFLHEAQDPGNLGSILRTLAWFGGFRCLLGPRSVDPYNPKAVRASMGAIFHVPVETDVPLETLRERFARIACLDLRGERLSSDAFRAFDCYVFGNEARGLPRAALAALGARSFAVPGSGAIESLNLAAAVNMCAYELNR